MGKVILTMPNPDLFGLLMQVYVEQSIPLGMVLLTVTAVSGLFSANLIIYMFH